jgi:hypothetical protein
MPHPDRRSILAAASAALLALAGPARAESVGIAGTVAFADEAPIPKGRLRIVLDVPGSEAPEPAPSAELVTDGKATAVDFALTRPDGANPAGLRVVARLEREDGFLLARGSAPVEPGTPVHIILRIVMY